MPQKKLEEKQLVMCSVTKIIGTIVFVRIEDYNLEGTLTFSEIFPGKIRNIRDFVFPGKQIVCKVLNIKPQVIEVSLRRVKVNERNEFNDKYKRERNYTAFLRTVLGDVESSKVIEQIKSNEESFVDFLEASKEKPESLVKYVSKEHATKIAAGLKEKKSKEVSVTKKFSISSKADNGIKKIKEIVSSALVNYKGCEVSYVAAGKYAIKIKSSDPRTADQQLRAIMQAIEASAKKNNCFFEQEKD